jgi:autotransporter-associated beta strand protein
MLGPLRAWAGGTLTAVSVSYDPATQKATQVDTFSNPPSTTTTTVNGSSVDVSAAIAANAALDLTNIQAKVLLSTVTTTYTGIISGTGTLEIGQTVYPQAAMGTGATRVTATNDGAANPVPNGASLLLTQLETLHLAANETTESTSPAPQNTVVVTGINPPLITIDPGVTLVYSGSGSTNPNFALIDSSGQINLDNILDNGVLQVSSVDNGSLLGAISGAGSVSGEAFFFHGPSAFRGVLDNEIATFYGSSHVATSLPNAIAIINNGSLLVSSPPGSAFLTRQNIYESHFGDDINTDTGLNVFAGVYSNCNNTSRQRPNLVNPGLLDPTVEGTTVTGTIGLTGDPAELNFMVLRYSGSDFTALNHLDANATQDSALDDGINSSFRGINIEGGTTQWGDGTTNVFFLPAMPDNSYINLHNGATLAFEYDGSGDPVVLNTPIGGGTINASLTAPGKGNVEIMNPVAGHDVVVFAQPMFYQGTTTIDAGATLQIGLGKPTTTYGQSIELERDNSLNYDKATVVSTYSGDSNLLLYSPGGDGGAAADRIVDNGTLIVKNTENGVTLSNISGTGKVIQQGVPNAAAAGGTPDTSAPSQSVLLALLPGTTKPEVPALTLTGVNTYSGGTTVAAGATLLVGSPAALGSAGGGIGDVVNGGVLATTGGNHVIQVPGNYTQ